MSIVSRDSSVLLDFLVSNETCFLLYLLRYLKFIVKVRCTKGDDSECRLKYIKSESTGTAPSFRISQPFNELTILDRRAKPLITVGICIIYRY